MTKFTHAIAHNAVNTLVVRPSGTPEPTIEILHADDCFAPGVEDTVITYRLRGNVDSGRIEIRSKRVGEAPVYVRELKASELAAGAKLVVAWDGECTATSGPLAGRMATPLFSPYEVKIVVVDNGTTKSAVGEVKVLYHSMRLVPAPWTPDGRAPKIEDGDRFQSTRRLWVQYRLNELGYWAGAVGDETGDCLEKAIVRYKMSHPRFSAPQSGSIDPAIDNALVKALKKGQSPRRFLHTEDGGEPFARSTTTRIYVEAMLAERGDPAVGRQSLGAVRLNRPAFALESEIFLRSRNGKPVSSRKAVGPARVNFRVHDVGEDLSRQVLRKKDKHHPALARLYIEKAREEAGGLDLNCPVSRGGIRTTSTPWLDAVLPGDAYACYATSSDPAKKVVKTRACADPAFPARRGRAGFVFRPSIIAGDGYRIEAEIDFSDEPNAAELENNHGKTIRTETGEIRIWRWLPVAGVIRWTEHPSAEVWNFGEYAKEFARAYIELAPPESRQPVPIVDILGNDEYLAAVAEAGLSPVEFEFDRAGIWGGKLPVLDKAATAFANHKTLFDAIEPQAETLLLNDETSLVVHRCALRRLGTGVVLVEFGVHRRVKLWDEGKVHDPAFQAAFPAHGYAGPIGVAWILDQPKDIGKKPMDKRWIALHEIGHTLFLQHYERTPDLYTGEMKSRPELHDAADDACLMSYADEHAHTPHFCGRCNLNLRGWNVKALPERSREDP